MQKEKKIMSLYTSKCPSFESYKPGMPYPWRNFTYNHSPDFICVSVTDTTKEAFTLSVVLGGKYQKELCSEDDDRTIDQWIRKVNVIFENEYGEHITAVSASDIRQYVKEYSAFEELYDQLREHDLALESQAFELSKFAQLFPAHSKERAAYERNSEECMEKHNQEEEAVRPLIDSLNKIFARKWYKDTPADDIFLLGSIVEQYHAVMYGKLKDMVHDKRTLVVFTLKQFHDLISESDKELFIRYCNWNQPDHLTLDMFREMLGLTERLFDV